MLREPVWVVHPWLAMITCSAMIKRIGFLAALFSAQAAFAGVYVGSTVRMESFNFAPSVLHAEAADSTFATGSHGCTTETHLDSESRSDLSSEYLVHQALDGTAHGVSFESKLHPGWFLRHQYGYLCVQPYSSQTLYLRDSSFYVRPVVDGTVVAKANISDTSWIRLESPEYPGNFIRHSYGYGRLSPWGSDASMVKDSVFKLQVVATNRLNILPVGDSITYGYGSWPLSVDGTNAQWAPAGGYRVSLFDHLSSLFGNVIQMMGHNTVINGVPSTYVDGAYSGEGNGPNTTPQGRTFDRRHMGYPSWRTDQVLGATKGVTYPNGNPDFILIHLGTNDIGQGYQTSATSWALDHVGAMIDDFSSRYPDSYILVASIIQRFDRNFYYSSTVDNYNSRLPAVVASRVAQGKRVIFVDMANDIHANTYNPIMPAGTCWNGSANVSIDPFFYHWASCGQDYIHPSVDGYASMATVWMNYIHVILGN